MRRSESPGIHPALKVVGLVLVILLPIALYNYTATIYIGNQVSNVQFSSSKLKSQADESSWLKESDKNLVAKDSKTKNSDEGDDEGVDPTAKKDMGKFVDDIKSYTGPKFEHPYRALKLLEVLDPFNVSFQIRRRLPYFVVNFHWVKEDDYCKNSRDWFVHHPEDLFTHMYTFSDRKLHTPIRTMVQPHMGTDLHPLYQYVAKQGPMIPYFELSPRISMYFTVFLWGRNYDIHKNYACSHQMFSQLPGLNVTISKQSMTKLYKNYNDQFNIKPECQPNLMPESFMMDNVTQCHEFFDNINDPTYEELKKKYNIVYIYKLLNHVHGGKAVMVFDEELEKKTREQFADGHKCGTFESKLLMQRYLNNPFLVMNHKFDFRVFALIASTDPLIVYYHDGYLRVSLSEYSPDSKEKSSHITNTGISRDMFKIARENGTWHGMTEDELREFQTWTFERFGKYMYESGQVDSPTWIDTFLRPKMQEGMIHMVRTMQQNLPKSNNMYQFVGVDFILDTDFRLWFIEANVRPGLDGVSRDRTTLVFNTLSDHYEIMFGLLRSRMKRIIGYINELSRKYSMEKIEAGIDKLPNFKKIKSKFNKLNKNGFEPEFEPSLRNQFVKVIDESLKGPAKYAGFIPEKCIW